LARSFEDEDDDEYEDDSKPYRRNDQAFDKK
jgi:hypothetical protein